MPDSSPKRAETIRTAAAHGGSARSRDDLARRIEQEIAGRHGAPSHHHHLGIQRVHDARQPGAQPAPDLGQHRPRDLVALRAPAR